MRVIALLLIIVSINIGAEESSNGLTYHTLNEANLMKYWKLDQKEAKRFKEIMKGPQGVWTPNLDPITTLGLHARNEKERMKYAEKLAVLDRKRVEQWRLLEIAMSKAHNLIAPNEQIIDVKKLQRLKQNSAQASLKPLDKLKFGDRILYFTETQCSACTSMVESLISKLKKAKVVNLDLYFKGKSDNEDIQKWARKSQIPPEFVKRKKITLNRDKGELTQLENQAGVSSTGIYLYRNGKYIPIDEV